MNDPFCLKFESFRFTIEGKRVVFHPFRLVNDSFCLDFEPFRVIVEGKRVVFDSFRFVDESFCLKFEFPLLLSILKLILNH